MAKKSAPSNARQAKPAQQRLRPAAPETPLRAPRQRAAAPKAAAGKPAAKPAAAEVLSEKDDKNPKPKKTKLVRDSFTMPQSEYDLIAALKKRCLAKGLAVKKSEVLRAAVIAFAARSDATVTAALKALTVIKTGRPPKVQK